MVLVEMKYGELSKSAPFSAEIRHLPTRAEPG